jgi:hypothetical protein
MKLKVLSWNVGRAKTNDSQIGDIITKVNLDMTLQGVISIPDSIYNTYSVNSRKATSKIGMHINSAR